MAQTELLIQANTIPGGLCYSTPQADYPVLASFLRAIFNGSEINFGSTTPAPADRTKPWVRTNPDGSDDGMWVFYGGFWVQKYPLPTGAVIMWEGELTDIPTFDGGEVAPVTTLTGPFYEAVAEMSAKSPMHPGTLPAGDVITMGTDFGEDRHTLSVAELATHTHVVHTFSSGATGGDGGDILNKPDPGNPHDHDTAETGSSTPFNVVHPVRAIGFLRRTARLYRRRNA